MNRPELYKKTVDILYQAYFNDTLEHGCCSKCAVGNLCLAAGAKPADGCFIPEGSAACWKSAFHTDADTKNQELNLIAYHANLRGCKTVIDATGYKLMELVAIEYAFESAPKGVCGEDYMFNGLVAVLEVLKKIHEITDDSLVEANQKRFADHHKKLTA